MYVCVPVNLGKADIWIFIWQKYVKADIWHIIVNPSQMCVRSNLLYTFTCNWNASKILFAT